MAPDLPVMRVTFEPGWKFPLCKAGSQTERPGTPLGVRCFGPDRVRMDDGQEIEYGPGDVGLIPPGDDAWVVGDEPYVNIDYQGGAVYAKP